MDRPRILVVEDEAIVASDIQDSLKKLGFDVCATAARGDDAIRKANELRPELALVDIKLKGEMDGIQAAARIRTELDIPIVYLTAHADRATLDRAKITDPYGYVLKPFEEIELRVALEFALHRHQLRLREKNTAPSSAAAEQTAEQGVELTDPNHLAAARWLRQIDPFTKLPEEGIRILARHCICRKFPAGEYVAFEGDLDTNGFLVLSGRIAMVKTSASGRDLIVELLAPGDIYGLTAALGRSSYSLSIRVQIPSEVLSVKRETIVLLLDRYPELYRHIIDVLAARLQNSHNLSRALAHDRVEVRIVSALVALVPRLGERVEMANIAEVPITRQELADLTGTTVETAIRVTKSMERDGLLDLSTTGIIKINNLPALSQLIAE